MNWIRTILIWVSGRQVGDEKYFGDARENAKSSTIQRQSHSPSTNKTKLQSQVMLNVNNAQGRSWPRSLKKSPSFWCSLKRSPWLGWVVMWMGLETTIVGRREDAEQNFPQWIFWLNWYLFILTRILRGAISGMANDPDFVATGRIYAVRPKTKRISSPTNSLPATSQQRIVYVRLYRNKMGLEGRKSV